jgi:hypothetical protein
MMQDAYVSLNPGLPFQTQQIQQEEDPFHHQSEFKRKEGAGKMLYLA